MSNFNFEVGGVEFDPITAGVAALVVILGLTFFPSGFKKN